MLFKVTHIDPDGHRHRARVTAGNARDAMEQLDREFGDARAGACVRMAAHPALCLVVRSNAALREGSGRVLCGS